MQKSTTSHWDEIIEHRSSLFDIDFNEIIRYRDLIQLFIKRDFVTFYQQTILGPLWYIIQPLFNAIVFTVIFGKVANIPTDGLPQFIFYLSGTIMWSYFSHCLSEISNTFSNNSQLFGKVYFPRITVPISISITAVFQFIVQFLIFLAFFFYFKYQGSSIDPNIYILSLPFIILHMAILSIGVGLLISALTAKYKDLAMAMSFMVQLWMYLTPIVYPLSEVPEKFRVFILINPMTAIVESFRGAFLGTSDITRTDLGISVLISMLLFTVGVIVFNKVQKTFMDTV
jgi:lipopolysaccharide transport system permease protein